MISRLDPNVYPIVCKTCGRPEHAHSRVNGECFVFARAEVKPYALRLRRKPAAAVGWRVRP